MREPPNSFSKILAELWEVVEPFIYAIVVLLFVCLTAIIVTR